jgi:hypothetical protein
MNPDQSNTKPIGEIPVLAGENLTGKRSYLAVLTHDTGIAEVKLPTSITDPAIYLVNEDVADTELTSVMPLVNGQLARVPIKGAANPGDIAVLADPATPADKGKIRKVPATAGAYGKIGIIEQVAVDAQLALVRVEIGLHLVAAQLGAPAACGNANGVIAGLNSTAVNPTKGDFDGLLAAGETLGDDVRALRETVNSMHAALIAAGILVLP